MIQILGVMKQKIWMSLPKVHQKIVKNITFFGLVKAIQTNNAEEMFPRFEPKDTQIGREMCNH